MMNEKDDLAAYNSSNYRRVVINGPQTTNFPNNAISTTKYSVLTFVPLFLFEQFHNYTNCFFLLVSVIQQFPEASSLGRFTTLLPLCIILIVAAIKEIIEDVQRYRDDKKVNGKTVDVFRENRWINIEWRQVQAGDFIKVHEDEFFPADMLLLNSSCESDICYIETVNLDGENNLKIRRRVPLSGKNSTNDIRGFVKCDQPNEQIYNFGGMLLEPDDGIIISLSADQLLLRGATLRNTEWIVGVVIYAGHDTKIMRNSHSTRLKRSSISISVNYQIIALFVLFVSLTLINWILFMYWNNENYKKIWYLPINRQKLNESSTLIVGLIFGVIYSIVIPVSLQVMQDLSRYIHAIFINNDRDMYDESSKTPARVKTSSLSEDLGLVKYIFADKTGTLTKNKLEFKGCSIGGVAYDLPALKLAADDNDDYNDGKSRTESLRQFFTAICLCPGVITVPQNDSTTSYYASSPDQKTLVLAANEFGCILRQRDHCSAEMRTRDGKSHLYRVLCDFEFTSDRKRSSTIVKCDDGRLILYTMGADDVVLARCTRATGSKDATRRQIDEYATRGLRSICVATRVIEPADFEQWWPALKRAQTTFTDKAKLEDEAEARIVRDLTLLGATAVEDELQDDVPQTIECLREAGINMWVLTGDKLETAVNIGYACRLFSNEMPTIILNSMDVETLKQIIYRYTRKMGDDFGKPGNAYGLIVTGDCLNSLLKSHEEATQFVTLMLSCQSVICCRTTPKQKALVVKTVQKYTDSVTLAIGDGANDVAMIQTASIGVGISGVEGLQAANAADYSVGQFKYLKKLLLVHGTWNYNRIGKLVYFIHYKNVIIVAIQFYYIATTAWSGQVFIDVYAKMLYNILLTSAPTIALGIFEQNLPADTLMKYPRVYASNNWFNLRSFGLWLLNALAHSILLFWLVLRTFDSNVFWSSGRNDQYAFTGNIVYTCLLLVVCLKSVLHTHHWTNMTFVFLLVSFILWIFELAFLSYCWPFIYAGQDMSSMIEIMFTAPAVLLFLPLVIVAILFIDLTIVVLYRIFCNATVTSLRTLSLEKKLRSKIIGL